MVGSTDHISAVNSGSTDDSTSPSSRHKSHGRRLSLIKGISGLGRQLQRLSLFGSRRHLGALSSHEEKQLDYMLGELTDDELEMAARSSYTYLKSPHTQQALKRKYAQHFALKFLRSKKDEKKALEKMKATLQFRKEKDIDGLRLAFDDPESPYREPLQKQLESKMLKVQGFDREGRSTYIFTPRHTKSHDEEWTIKEHIYTLERAIACSTSADKTVNAVVDFNGFSALRHAPPTSIGKEFMLTLRNHYAGNVHGIYLVDAPVTFNALWNIFKPLVGTKTRGKIHFVKGKHSKLSKFYDKEQAPEWMVPGGLKNRELDVEEYLLKSRFNESFDE